ncbi:MAG: aldo/keto reductase [Proteobacteria bacterium]|nr:aldo/keto reductase [Pseudomonadota bacterium]
MSFIGLGTAQLGVPYGNKANFDLMSMSEAGDIVDLALAQGLPFIDTAIAYGSSEERLGQLRVHERSPKTMLSTKIPAVSEEIWKDKSLFLAWVQKHIGESLRRLNMPTHELLQFHQCEEAFLRHPSVLYVFQKILDMPEVKTIGISVYSLNQAFAAMETESVSWLQVPVNIIDRRFVSDDFLMRSKAGGIKLIARSALLQGVLAPNGDLPTVKRLEELRELRSLAQDACKQMHPELSLEEAALRFLFANQGSHLDVILIGVDSSTTLRHNLAIINRAKEPLPAKDLALFDRAVNLAAERELFNPATWNK